MMSRRRKDDYFERLLEELRHQHEKELAEVQARAETEASGERMPGPEPGLEVGVSTKSSGLQPASWNSSLPDPVLGSSQKVAPPTDVDCMPPDPVWQQISEEAGSQAPDTSERPSERWRRSQNEVTIEEEIINAKKKDDSAKDIGLSLDSPDPLPRDASRLAHALESDRYELLVGATVLSSVAIMAADYQYNGYSVGQTMGFKGMGELPLADPSPGWIPICSLILDIIFAVDVVIRVVVLRLRFFRLWVNWIDVMVVLLSIMGTFLLGMESSFNIWVLRMLRLAKVARALRLMRMRRALESLSLLLRCVQSSLQVLFWSLGLLGVIQCIAGMVIGQLLMPYMQDDAIDVELRTEVYKYFGTFNRTLLTMFEVLFANWAIPARVCIENVSEGFIYIFIFYRCLVGFAVLNVVSAVFVQQTMKVAQADQEYLMSQKRKQVEAYASKLKRFFTTLDASGDGLLSWDEFSVLLSDPQLQLWMSTLDLETQDLVSLFQMIDDGDGEISVEEFIDGATRLRGMARSLDVAQVLTSIKKLELKIEDIRKNMGRRRGHSSSLPSGGARGQSVYSVISAASDTSSRLSAKQ